MSLLSSVTVLGPVDSLAVAISTAYQLARVRLASAASPVLRLLVQRDHALGEVELLRRESPPRSTTIEICRLGIQI